jgi:hypothetical protein
VGDVIVQPNWIIISYPLELSQAPAMQKAMTKGKANRQDQLLW